MQSSIRRQCGIGGMNWKNDYQPDASKPEARWDRSQQGELHS